MKILSTSGILETLCEHLNAFAIMREFSTNINTGLVEADFVINGNPNKMPSEITESIGLDFVTFEIRDETPYNSKIQQACINLSIQMQDVNGKWMYISGESVN